MSSDDSADESCQHPECSADPDADGSGYVDAGSGKVYCSKTHLLAAANGKSLSEVDG